jgi:hypothetical protein
MYQETIKNLLNEASQIESRLNIINATIENLQSLDGQSSGIEQTKPAPKNKSYDTRGDYTPYPRACMRVINDNKNTNALLTAEQIKNMVRDKQGMATRPGFSLHRIQRALHYLVDNGCIMETMHNGKAHYHRV